MNTTWSMCIHILHFVNCVDSLKNLLVTTCEGTYDGKRLSFLPPLPPLPSLLAPTQHTHTACSHLHHATPPTHVQSTSLSGQGLDTGMFDDSLEMVISSASREVADAASDLQNIANQLNANLTELHSIATQFVFAPTSERLPVAETARYVRVLV